MEPKFGFLAGNPELVSPGTHQEPKSSRVSALFFFSILPPDKPPKPPTLSPLKNPVRS
ncbi:hypothetical protein SLEP1_g60084 [Rubroshorea leprosula]|uniref:Uncharacterized protein n=1 Tax=Rubroshorea leprosula TaxID=152421 RepID=A0AAV5MU99_9ROSI|nr:hypothetical protein SLEP1_g60084 [Rubroshorea leprosula]